MRTWDLTLENPLNFTLAADSRFSEPDHLNDQIWELSIGKGEPAAILLHSTFGLRTRAIQIFPRFILNENSLTDPFSFHTTPFIKNILPNYLSLEFLPIPEINIFSEYWVPDSQSVCGRYLFTNSGNKVVTFRFELASILRPLDEGENMSPYPFGTTNVLLGKTHNLSPVLMLSGEPQASQSPFPALTQDLQIVPGKTKALYWAIASLEIPDKSLNKARDILKLPWEAEIAKIFMINNSQGIEIYTGDPEWDLALAASQNTAYSLVMGKTHPAPPFVLTRKPDLGYSFSDNESGLSSLWKEQSTLDAYYLTSYLLPGGEELVKRILDNFLAKYEANSDQEATKNSHYSNGLYSKRTRLDQPLLCSISWNYYQATQNDDWITLSYPRLLNFLHLWFDQNHDKDMDNFPEWDDLYQSGLEESPTFDRWNPETQGLNIQTVETPALAAMLYQECRCMISLSKVIHQGESVPWLLNQLENLEKSINNCWNEKENTFNYRDYQNHTSQNRKNILEFSGSGSHKIRKSFPKPQRLILRIFGEDDTKRKFRISIVGTKDKEEINETIQYFDVSWLHGQAYYTTNNLFTRIDNIKVEGINEKDSGSIHTADHFHQDISLLMPLWANVLGHSRGMKLIEKTIKTGYWAPYGIPICPHRKNETFLANPAKVRVNWNHLIGEGLLNYNQQTLAAKLVQNIMQAIIINLKKFHGFREQYHSQTAEPSGEINHLRGLAPLKLFLVSLGVQLRNKDRVIIHGNNPYPWPVTVKYKGTSITRHEVDTVITFLNGQTVTVSGAGPYEITLVQEK